MGYNFEDKEKAKAARAKASPRGKANIPHELKQVLSELSFDNMDKVKDELSKLKGAQYLSYIIKILQLVVPKDLNIDGDVSIDGGDAKRKLIEKLLARASEGEDQEGGK